MVIWSHIAFIDCSFIKNRKFILLFYLIRSFKPNYLLHIFTTYEDNQFGQFFCGEHF